MLVMKRFSKTSRLQADSIGEIVDPFGDEARRLARQLDLEFAGRKLSGGPLLNAVALWYLGRPEAERNTLAREAVAQLEIFLAESDDAPQPSVPLPTRPARESTPPQTRTRPQADQSRKKQG